MEKIAFLALTIVIEVPVALMILQKPWAKVAIVGACASLITHPFAWEIYNQGTPLPTVEIGVAIIESSIFTLLFPERRMLAIFTAIAMNAISATIGVLFF